MKVRLTLIAKMLGTWPANPELAREHLAGLAPDAKTVEEQIADTGVDAQVEKSMTCFPRFDGKPGMWAYQVKGFLKEAVNALRDTDTGEIKSHKRLTKYLYKRTLDNGVFVTPDDIPFILPIGVEIGEWSVGNCQRPLRCETMRGERVALANSESVPRGTIIECEITCLDSTLEKHIRAALDYGKWKGIGQWRNSGKGRFSWEEIA